MNPLLKRKSVHVAEATNGFDARGTLGILPKLPAEMAQMKVDAAIGR
jgi:hypothetical protein